MGTRDSLPGRVLADAGRIGRDEHRPVGATGRPLCRWCELEIMARRRRTFCSEFCVHQWRLRSDPGYLREQVFLRDKGVCALCHANTVAVWAALKRSRGEARAAGLRLYGMAKIGARRSLWEADHIVSVVQGGGECDLDNLRTLCLLCHREETRKLVRQLRGGRGGRARSVVAMVTGVLPREADGAKKVVGTKRSGPKRQVKT